MILEVYLLPEFNVWMIRILKTLLSRPPKKSAVTVAFIALGALVLGAMLDWYVFSHTRDIMPATRTLVFEKGEFWRLFTTLFVHGDFGHLAANSLLYFILAYYLYGHFGFVLFPLTAWLLAIPMTAFALITYRPDTHLIGASGLVHLMGGLWLSLYFFIARDMSLTQRILRAGGVMLGIFFPTSFEPTTSYRTHFIGLFLGILYGTLYYKMNSNQFHAAEVLVEEPEEESLVEEQSLTDIAVQAYDFDSDENDPPRGTRDH